MSAGAEAGGEPLPSPDAAGVARAADGTRIAWRSYGEGEPVVMLMGFMGSGRAWFRLLPHIAAGRRALLVDNRGTGDSDRRRGLWTMPALASDAIAAMDAAEIERAHVLGASMGGMIAQHVALDHPARVRSLALCCTHAGAQRGSLSWRMVAGVALRPLLGARRSFPFVAPILYSPATRETAPERVREDLRIRMLDATPVSTAPAQFAAIARHDTRRRLGELELPVLVVHGEEDRLVPVAAGREIARLAPHAELVTLPGAGHVLTTDAEQETAAAIVGFLDRVESGATG